MVPTNASRKGTSSLPPSYLHSICFYTLLMFFFFSSQVSPFTFELDQQLSSRRRVGVPFAGDIAPSPICYAVTTDGRAILSCGHWDNSFKISYLLPLFPPPFFPSVLSLLSVLFNLYFCKNKTRAGAKSFFYLLFKSLFLSLPPSLFFF